MNLRTLNRFKVTPRDYVDLSNRILVLHDESSEDNQSEPTEQPPDETSSDSPPARPTCTTISYAERKHVLHDHVRTVEPIPFPANTRGFFYYLPGRQTPISGQIRFRLVPTGTRGADTNLLDEYGLPWNIPLLAVAHSRRFKPLSDVLQRDDFLTSRLLKKCGVLQESIGGIKLGPFSQLVATIRQPFHVDLSNPDTYILVPGRNSLHQLHHRYMFQPPDDPSPGYWPYEGQ